MIPYIVEIAENGRYLCKDRGFLVVKSGKDELGKIPIDDIGMLLINAHGLTYSNNLLIALAERTVPVVFCDAKHLPSAVLWPVETHHMQVERFEAQINASKPLKKRLWQKIIQSKIRNQSSVIEYIAGDSKPLRLLIQKVKSGDSGNTEANASIIYWKMLFGLNFKRDRTQKGINLLLNYGYTVLRSAVARSVMTAGLHPSFGIHHHNMRNAMCLVDDLIEPFRPVVDQIAYKLVNDGQSDLTSQSKKILAKVYFIPVKSGKETQPMYSVLNSLASSLSQIYLKERNDLFLPDNILPLDNTIFQNVV